jgi:Protein of unknown function (DUF2905)
LQRWLILLGVVFLVVGLAWPWLARLGLGHLPGDIHIEREDFSFHFPLVTCIVISVVVSLIFWIFRK